MAHILHIDTATDTGYYFVAKDGQLVFQKDSGANRDHAATLAGIIADLLGGIGLSLKDIDAIAVNGGPGSYTGLRIGLAAAKGYCFALQKPLLLANRLLLLLHTMRKKHSDKNLLAILPARTGEYFAAAMDAAGSIILEPQHLLTEALGAWLVQAGPFAAIGALQADLATRIPDIQLPYYLPEVWADLAGQQFTAGAFSDVAAAEPYYLKAAFTTQSRKHQPGNGDVNK